MIFKDKSLSTIEIEFSDCHHGICEVIESLEQLVEEEKCASECLDLVEKLEKARVDIDAAVNSMKERGANIQDELEDVLRRFFQ